MLTRGISSLLLLFWFAACSSSPPIRYDQRVDYLEDRIATLEQRGWAEVLTPDEFHRAREAYRRAIDLIDRGAPDRDIVNAINRAEVNLILAENRARRYREEHPEIAENLRREQEKSVTSTAPVRDETGKH